MTTYYVTALVVCALIGWSSAEQRVCPTPPTTTTCDGKSIDCCEWNFRDSLDLTTKCDNKTLQQDPDCMREYIEYIYATNGFNGVFNVCTSFYNFQTCMGNQYKDCISARYNILNGSISYPMAELFETIFAQFNFACGAGMESFLYEDQCMTQVFANNMSQLRRCRDEFYNNVVSNEYLKCYYLAQLVSCYEKPFKDACGLEAGWWGCEYERIGTSLFLPECSPTCLVYQSRSISAQNMEESNPLTGI